MAGFPKVVYHPEHDARVLTSEAEVAALGSGWHESPAFNEPIGGVREVPEPDEPEPQDAASEASTEPSEPVEATAKKGKGRK